jgi:hypothetical protein
MYSNTLFTVNVQQYTFTVNVQQYTLESKFTAIHFLE